MTIFKMTIFEKPAWLLVAILFSQSASAQPEPRETGYLFYLPAEKSLFLFDGFVIHPDSASYLVWKWDGSRWNSKKTPGPPMKTLSSGGYNTRTGEVVLFGGIGKRGYEDLRKDSWSFNGQRWKEIHTNDIDTRDHHKMIYMEHLGCFLLYGGQNSKRDSDSTTWLLRDSLWTSLAVKGPGPRYHFGMAYDPVRKKAVLYGGYGPRGIQQDTWEFDGTIWSKITEDGPGPRGRFSMTWDSDRKMVIMHGGDVWKKKVDSSVYKDGEIWDLRGDTWGWDGKTWVKIADNGPARMLVALGYDDNRHVLVAFGGGAPGVEDYMFSDTWELKGNQWVQVDKGAAWKWNGREYVRQ